MAVTVITVGGGRQEALTLCEKYMSRQTYKGEIQWIFIEDEPSNPMKLTMGQEIYEGPLLYTPGINTQRYNLDLALQKVKGEYVIIWENDDFFGPEYIEIMLHYLKYNAMVGECDTVYYSIPSKSYLPMNNFKHASTTQTAFRKSSIPFFQKALHSGEKYFDITLWAMAREGNISSCLFSMPGKKLCVGMKGLPGRGGIGVGHRPQKFIDDSDGRKLRELLGLDAKNYKDWIK